MNAAADQGASWRVSHGGVVITGKRFTVRCRYCASFICEVETQGDMSIVARCPNRRCKREVTWQATRAALCGATGTGTGA